MIRHASKYILIAISAVAILAGCDSKEKEPDYSGIKDSPAFTATIGYSGSRAFDTSWEQGDEIGISGCSRSNICYLTDSGDGIFRVKTNGEQIYFQGDASAEFTAYYPWADLAAGTSTVQADTRLQNNQKSFDFLWAKASGSKYNPEVSFNFSHRMTKLSLTVKPGEGMSYDEIKDGSLSLDGIRYTGSFNTADGSTATGAVDDAWTFTEFARLNDDQQTLNFSFILFPQNFDSDMAFLAELNMPGDKILSLRASIDFTGANRVNDGADAKNELVAGRQYNLSLTLNKTDITLQECVINPWNVVDGDNIVVD